MKDRNRICRLGKVNSSKAIQSFAKLEVYQAAFYQQQVLFKFSQSWPKEERYSLTDQIRRSSRSIGANLAESWAKRAYPAHFLSKLSDADGELQETFHWLTTAHACAYLGESETAELMAAYQHIGKMLGSMMAKHESFCGR